MRVLALHEISSGICGGGGRDTLGPTPTAFGCENAEGMHVAAATVGAIGNAVAYMAGSSIIGHIERVGIVNGLAYGWALPLAADVFLRGDQLTPRIARAAFIGAAVGMVSASVAADRQAR